jgi:hypothetical protein
MASRLRAEGRHAPRRVRAPQDDRNASTSHPAQRPSREHQHDSQHRTREVGVLRTLPTRRISSTLGDLFRPLGISEERDLADGFQSE